MPAVVSMCIWCQKRLHSHCDGLRFTASGIPFKPVSGVGCSCKLCDHVKERWIYCDKCKTNLVVPGLLICANCLEGD